MGSRAPLARSLLVALVLFLCSAAVVVLLGKEMGADDPRGWLLALAVPLSASASIPVLASFFPALLLDGRIRFPLNVTLPLVHGALLVAFAAIYGTTGVAVVAVPEPLQAAVSWAEPARWGPSVALQMLVLTLGVAAARRVRR